MRVVDDVGHMVVFQPASRQQTFVGEAGVPGLEKGQLNLVPAWQTSISGISFRPLAVLAFVLQHLSLFLIMPRKGSLRCKARTGTPLGAL